MLYIKVEDNIVTMLISTDRKHPEPWISIPDNSNIRTGADVRHYDGNWRLKPTDVLVSEGHLKLNVSDGQDGYAEGTVLQHVVDNKIVNKTDDQLALEGARPLHPYESIVDGVLVKKSHYEMVLEGTEEMPDGYYISTTKGTLLHNDEISLMLKNGDISNDDHAEYFSEDEFNRYLSDVEHAKISGHVNEVDVFASNPLRWMDLTPDAQQELFNYRRSLIALRDDRTFPFDLTYPTRPSTLDNE